MEPGAPYGVKIGSFGAKTLKNHNFKDISYPNLHYTINRHQTMAIQ